MGDLAKRFWERVDKSPGACWEWKGSKSKGYGQFYGNGRRYIAHRLSYELIVGPIPAGLVIDHLCRNRGCVNPAHLEPVTSTVNTMRGIGVGAKNAAKTHCKRGHEFTPENSFFRRDGSKNCRVCMEANTRFEREYHSVDGRRGVGRGRGARRPWLPDEDAKVEKHEPRDRDLAVQLNRTVAAIRNRREALARKATAPPPKPKAAPPGSYGDRVLRTLRAAHADGVAWMSLADLRSELGVSKPQALTVAVNRLVSRGAIERNRDHGFHRPRYRLAAADQVRKERGDA